MHKSFIINILFVIFILCAPAWAKSKKNASPAPPKRTTKQENKLRKDITVQPRKMAEDRDLRKNVRHTNGTWIANIPMYDQGSRPECAVACVKRLLDYYATGNQVDMKALRNALGYRKEFGTNMGTMIPAIQQYSQRLRLKFQPLYGLLSLTPADLAEYNDNIKKKESRITVENNVLDIEKIFRRLEFEPWKAMRCKQHHHEQRAVWKKITAQIDQGIPVVWGVQLGLVTEQKQKQKFGSHLRLVIGYNAGKGRIYYTDSWGKGHEKKEMPWDTAWAITRHLFVLSPMN